MAAIAPQDGAPTGRGQDLTIGEFRNPYTGMHFILSITYRNRITAPVLCNWRVNSFPYKHRRICPNDQQQLPRIRDGPGRGCALRRLDVLGLNGSATQLDGGYRRTRQTVGALVAYKQTVRLPEPVMGFPEVRQKAV
jgi:hypothetical protein